MNGNEDFGVDLEDMSRIRNDIKQIQTELQEALATIIQEAGKRLKPEEITAIREEFDELNTLLERLKSGKVYIALFGHTNAGKSSVANSLMEENIAPVGIEHDYTQVANEYEYKKGAWVFVDIPGIMGRQVLETLAVSEAKKALGHIFVIDDEPFADEIEMFDLIHKALPNTPKIVFYNKWDKVEGRVSKADVLRKKELVAAKMSKYVTSPDDIVYGSARLYDPAEEDRNPESEGYIRQDLPQLIDRLYEGAGTLGQVVNLIDPANKAHDLTSRIHEKIVGIRTVVARKVINAFAIASVAGGMVPFDTLTVQPGLLASLTFSLCRVMGMKLNKEDAKRMAKELVTTCGKTMALEFGAVAAADITKSVLGVFLPFLYPVFAAIDSIGLAYYRYRRTAIFGEVALEYVKRGCTWGADDARVVVAECRERANRHYVRLRPTSETFEDTAAKAGQT